MPDVLIRQGGSGAAPQIYKVPDTSEIILKALFASFDGSATTATWKPCIRIIAPGGSVVGEYTADSKVAPGGSADTSFAPFLGRGGGSGSDLLDFELNDILLATEPAIDFEDGGGVTWQVNDDQTNNRAKVSAIVQTGTSTPSVTLSSGTNIFAAGGFNAFPGGTRMANGNLIAIFASSTFEQIDAALFSSISTDDGATWGATSVVASPAVGHTLALIGSVTVLRDGTVFCLYFDHLNNPGNNGLSIKYKTSADNGVTWSTETTLTPYTSINFVAGPIIELANGHLLMPVGGADIGDTAEKNGVLLSTDGGSTWGSVVSVLGTGVAPAYQELVLIQVPSGEVIGFANALTALQVARVTSSDNGATWSIGSNLGFGTTSGIPSVALQNDVQIMLMVYRQAGTTSAVYRYSTDYGVTWSSEATLNSRIQEYVQVAATDNSLLGITVGLKHSIGNDSDVVFYTARATASRATRIVSGSVTAAGGVNTGHGFSVTHTLTGKYTITFDTAFVSTPACLATPASTAAFAGLVVSTDPSALGGPAPSAASFDVWIADPGLVNFRDCAFNFSAILT